MKTLITKLLLFTLLLVGINFPFTNINTFAFDGDSKILEVKTANAYVSVRGYYRSNGTYVAPHVRSNPNGLKYDNYSWTPSQGLYNPTYGTRGTTWDTPTYITDPNYYEGKSLYENGSSGSSNINVTPPPVKINNPANSYVSGSMWFCNSGYVKNGNSCDKINNPANSYVSGSMWFCNSGYKKVANTCEKINNPANSYVSGSMWFCNSGYVKNGNSCVLK